MKDILLELIKLIKENLAGRYTDCGGDLNEACNKDSCKHFHQCERNYRFTERLEELEKKAEEL